MSRVLVVTGGTTGIGASLVDRLKNSGNTVINIDLKDSDVKADLSNQEGRQRAISEILKKCPEGIDGLVTCAGLGPNFLPVDAISKVNYYGSIELVQGLKNLLSKKGGSVVFVSSNSAALPGLDEELVISLAEQEEVNALKLAATKTGQQNYAASKHAIIRWMRENAPEYIKSNINLNAVAPGITKTPLTDRAFADKAFSGAMQQFLQMTPYGEIATPDMIAKPIEFLLGEGAEFIVGSVIFIDGGVDAVVRPCQF